MAASNNRPFQPAPVASGAVPHQRQRAAPPPLLDGHRPDFTFEFRGWRTRFTEAQMVEALRARHAQLGRPFTIAEYNAWPERPCSGGLILLRFKLWRNAMKLAGIEGARGRDYTPAELIKNLERAWRTLGRRPGNHTFRAHSAIGIAPYQRIWGSLRMACKLFAKYKRGQLTRKALLYPARPGRRKLGLSLRWKILEAAGHRCTGCGKSSRDRGVRLEIDHITPITAGGTNDPKNLRVLCFCCNRGKGCNKPLARRGHARIGSASALIRATKSNQASTTARAKPSPTPLPKAAGRHNRSLVRKHEVTPPELRAPEGGATTPKRRISVCLDPHHP